MQSLKALWNKFDFQVTDINYGQNRAGKITYDSSTGRYLSEINYSSLNAYGSISPQDNAGLFFEALHEIALQTSAGVSYYNQSWGTFRVDYRESRGVQNPPTETQITNAWYANTFQAFSNNEVFVNNIARSIAQQISVPGLANPTWGY